MHSSVRVRAFLYTLDRNYVSVHPGTVFTFRVKIDNTKVIKATASIAVIYSLRIVPIGTQFYGWRVYSGCNYLTTISDLRVAYIIAAGCLLRHANFLARILVQDIWQFKTLLNLFAAINPLASDYLFTVH